MWMLYWINQLSRIHYFFWRYFLWTLIIYLLFLNGLSPTPLPMSKSTSDSLTSTIIFSITSSMSSCRLLLCFTRINHSNNPLLHKKPSIILGFYSVLYLFYIILIWAYQLLSILIPQVLPYLISFHNYNGHSVLYPIAY